MHREKLLLGGEIYCPFCGSEDLILGDVFWETFFEGDLSAFCSCRECNGKFELWFVSSCISWDDKEEDDA